MRPPRFLPASLICLFLVAAPAPGQIERVSVDALGREGVGLSDAGSISADGRCVAFESAACLVGDGPPRLHGCLQVYVFDRQTRAVTPASVDALGRPGVGTSCGPAISGDGGSVAFFSAAPLVPGDTNGFADAYVRDRTTGRTILVSVNELGQIGNDHSGGYVICSYRASISGDGRKVAFHSHASNLVPGDANGVADIFVHDRDADGNGVFDEPGGTSLVRASVSDDGVEGNGDSGYPWLSADGLHVVFVSDADNLVADDVNGEIDVFVRDLVHGRTVRVSVSTSGVPSDHRSCGVAISGDGRFVTFGSRATNLVDGETDPDTTYDNFVHDRDADEDGAFDEPGGVGTEKITRGWDGSLADGPSYRPVISEDGRYVAYPSEAENLVPDDANGCWDIFLHDRWEGTTLLVSRGFRGRPTDGDSKHASLAGRARTVSFVSEATNLVWDDTNGTLDVFVAGRDAYSRFAPPPPFRGVR
jgi:hypothetical protein